MAYFNAYSQFDTNNVRDFNDQFDDLLRTKTSTGYLVKDPASIPLGAPRESGLFEGTMSVGSSGNFTTSTVVTGVTRYSDGDAYFGLTNMSGPFNNNYFDTGYKVDNVTVGGESFSGELAYWLRGNDVMYGSTDADNLAGYAGNDVIHGQLGNDTVIGWSGNDRVYGDDGNDLLYGDYNGYAQATQYAGNDVMYGGEGNDSLFGCGGNDVLDGGNGENYLNGGLGDDTYYVYNGADQVVEASASGGTDLVYSSVNYEIGSNVENLTLNGYANIDGTGNSSANVITGNIGNNVLDGVANTANVGDKLIGGDGNDTYIIHSAKDTVVEQLDDGIDMIVFDSLTSYSLASLTNVENLTFNGLSGAVLTGNKLNNVLDASEAGGISILNGGAGNDMLIASDFGSILNGGEGNDELILGNGSDVVVANMKNLDMVYGFESGSDDLYFNPNTFTKLKNNTDFFAQVDSSSQVTSSTKALVFNTEDCLLYYNATGKAGGAVGFCELVGISNLNASDIVTVI